jgi:hypothetical protein
LFWRAADGTGRVEPLLESTSRPQPWGWTLDGRLLFDQAPGDTGVLAIEGERTVEMLLETEFTTEQPALSPDNRWLAYQSNESGRMEVFVQPFPNIDDGKWPVSTDRGFDPVWSPDGRELFYLAVPERIMVVEVETAPTFNPGTSTEAFDAYIHSLFGPRYYDLTPDGERFLMARAVGAQTDGEDQFTGLIVVENWFEETQGAGANPVACAQPCQGQRWPHLTISLEFRPAVEIRFWQRLSQNRPRPLLPPAARDVRASGNGDADVHNRTQWR